MPHRNVGHLFLQYITLMLRGMKNSPRHAPRATPQHAGNDAKTNASHFCEAF